MDVHAADRIDAIEDAMAAVNDLVVARLRLDAPEWVDYFEESPDWYRPIVSRVGEQHREQTDRLLDYVAFQLVRIQEGLRAGRRQP